MSAFLEIRDAIVARLLEAPALPGVQVFAGRRRAIPAEVPLAIVVRLQTTNGQAAGIANGPADWSTSFVVECHAADDQDAETAVDPLLEHVFARLTSLQLPGLGVMDVMPLPDIDWDGGETGSNHVCAVILCRATHRTLGTALTAWS